MGMRFIAWHMISASHERAQTTATLIALVSKHGPSRKKRVGQPQDCSDCPPVQLEYGECGIPPSKGDEQESDPLLIHSDPNDMYYILYKHLAS